MPLIFIKQSFPVILGDVRIKGLESIAEFFLNIGLIACFTFSFLNHLACYHIQQV